MLVLAVLIVSFLVFRALGFAGVSVFASWHVSGRDALAVMLFFTGSTHFTRMRRDFIRMIPPWVPWPSATVYSTGICEIAGALGLLLPRLYRAAGICLIIFFLAILPANIHAAKAGVTLGGRPATRLLARIPMQLLFIAWAGWSTLA
ncbi:MAG: DoxX family protein [Terriglobia bacterium]|jgi:uncharacterized membrane protein